MTVEEATPRVQADVAEQAHTPVSPRIDSQLSSRASSRSSSRRAQHGCDPDKQKNKPPRRDITGFILLDKPMGISSNRALQKVKGILRAKKAGHTGSLDPLATGMLPIALGEATKFSSYLLDADKTYDVRIQFGVRTTTSDAEGEVVAEKPVPTLTKKSLEKHLRTFLGVQTQIPSLFSAIKYQGKPLYEYARQGISVPVPAREITVHDISLIDFDETTARVHCHVSKGTYIRTLVDDLGEKMGCGAHVAALHRSSVAAFEASTMCTLEQLEVARDTGTDADHLLSVQDALSPLNRVTLSSENVHAIRHGQPVFVSKCPQDQDFLLMTEAGQMIGVGHINADGMLAPKRLISRKK